MTAKHMTNDEYLTQSRDHWEWAIVENEYRVYSPIVERYFTDTTLANARRNRSEAERVKREHDAKQPTT